MQPLALSLPPDQTSSTRREGSQCESTIAKLLTPLGAAQRGRCSPSPAGWRRPTERRPEARSTSTRPTPRSPATSDTIILTGAITDHGTDHQGVAGRGDYNLLALSKGTFSFEVSDAGNLPPNFPPLNPTTCSSDGTTTVPVPIVHGTGTGAYHGISGTFQITVTFASILPRLANGQCDTNATHYPGIQISRGAGTVSFK